jgi:DNA-binding NtrC family response regulator
VLEERTIERVGGSRPIPVDVRIVCATNRDLRAMVERGEFREDLYYRLSGLTLEALPLRERSSDLPCVCEALLGRIARERSAAAKRIASDALELLARHRWPGNVRELENALRAASLFADGDCIEVVDLVEHVEVLRKLAAEPFSSPSAALDVAQRGAANLPPPARCAVQVDTADAAVCVSGAAYDEIRASGVSLSELKRQIERECIAQALTETGGNITRAAAVLGMKRPRLSQLVKQYGLLEDDEGGTP